MTIDKISNHKNYMELQSSSLHNKTDDFVKKFFKWAGIISVGVITSPISLLVLPFSKKYAPPVWLYRKWIANAKDDVGVFKKALAIKGPENGFEIKNLKIEVLIDVIGADVLHSRSDENLRKIYDPIVAKEILEKNSRFLKLNPSCQTDEVAKKKLAKQYNFRKQEYFDVFAAYMDSCSQAEPTSILEKYGCFLDAKDQKLLQKEGVYFHCDLNKIERMDENNEVRMKFQIIDKGQIHNFCKIMCFRFVDLSPGWEAPMQYELVADVKIEREKTGI